MLVPPVVKFVCLAFFFKKDPETFVDDIVALKSKNPVKLNLQ